MKILTEDLATIRSVANWFGKRAHAESDELMNIAVIELLSEKEYVIDGVRAKLIRKIASNAIKDFLRETRPMIKIPTRSINRHSLNDLNKIPVDPQTFAISESMGPEETVMIEDSLLHAAQSPMEKAYIKLRISGLTNQEAIVDLDISSWKASTMLRDIEQRFREDWYE